MHSISQLLFVIAPIALGGVLNMVVVKSAALNRWKKPLDHGRCWSNGTRLLGNNKTYKGLAGMVGCTALSFAAFGLVLDAFPSLTATASLYDFTYRGMLSNPLTTGALLGLAYILAELPNSFVKRRLGIEPGKAGNGRIGQLFTLVDQADSVVGCLAVLLVVTPITWSDAVALLCLATATHYIVNILLYHSGLRTQRG